MYRLNEIGDTPKGQYALGQVYARANKRRSGITDAWTKQMPKKEYYTAAEYYPKGTEKYDDIMHDAKAEAECPTNRKVNMKPVVYNDKGYETTNFGLGMMDYEKSHKTNENNQYTNMNKKLIRLTESDLHKIVKESVKSVLREVYYIDYDMVTQYPHKNFREAEPPIEDFYDADDYYAKPIEHPDDPNRQWDAYNRRNQFMKDVAYDAMTYHPHYVDNDNDFNKDSRKYAKSYAKGEPYDFANNGGGRIAAGVRGKALNDFDKQWQDQEDREKYSKMADSRPLYRKNSPNKDIPR